VPGRDQQGQVEAVVGMEMGDEDRLGLIKVDPNPGQVDAQRGAGVEEHGSVDEDAGVVGGPRKRVPAAQEGDVHGDYSLPSSDPTPESGQRPSRPSEEEP
jgi:hypothetical protein